MADIALKVHDEKIYNYLRILQPMTIISLFFCGSYPSLPIAICVSISATGNTYGERELKSIEIQIFYWLAIKYNILPNAAHADTVMKTILCSFKYLMPARAEKFSILLLKEKIKLAKTGIVRSEIFKLPKILTGSSLIFNPEMLKLDYSACLMLGLEQKWDKVIKVMKFWKMLRLLWRGEKFVS